MDNIQSILQTLRGMGCAVCCIPPEQLHGTEPLELEARLDADAAGFIKTLRQNSISDITSEIESMGFSLISTGGGCEAWYMPVDKHYMFLLSNDGQTARNLNRHETLYLAYFERQQDHSDPITSLEANWQTIRPMVSDFRSGKWAATHAKAPFKNAA